MTLLSRSRMWNSEMSREVLLMSQQFKCLWLAVIIPQEMEVILFIGLGSRYLMQAVVKFARLLTEGRDSSTIRPESQRL